MKPFSYQIRLLVILTAVCASYAGAQTTSDYDVQIQHGTAELQAGSADQALASGDAAIRINPERWDGYALSGRALLSQKRYEAAADALSQAIERAPASQQPVLRDLRRQCLVAESGVAAPGAAAPVEPAVPAPSNAVASAPARVAKASAQPPRLPAPVGRAGQGLENAVWVDPAGLMWARPWYYPAAGKAASWNYAQSASFCAALRLLDYSDWRLPTLEELQRIYLVSSKGWRWSYPKFDPAYGINDALSQHQWRPASFSAGGDTFNGDRLLIWTSTPGDEAGQHAAVYFGRRYSVSDDSKDGTSLKGTSRNPFQGYAFCVRPAQGDATTG